MKPDNPKDYDMYYDGDVSTVFIYFNKKWQTFSSSLTREEERYLKLKELGFDGNNE
jgi:phosphopantetheine adenylyltransferase